VNSALSSATAASSIWARLATSFQSSGDAAPKSPVDANARPLAVKRGGRTDDDEDDRSGSRRTERSGSAARGDSASSTFIDLKIRIKESFSAQSSGAGSENSASSNGFEGQFEASIRVNGNGTSFDAKLELQSEGNGSADAFNQAVQSFTQALFGALRSLYGALTGPTATGSATPGVTSGGTTPLLPSTGTATTGPAAASAAGATPPATQQPAPATAPVATTTASSTTDTGALATEVVPAAATSTPASTTSAGTASIVVKLRLSYSSFEGSVGQLMKQLTQPDVASTAPQVAPLLDDLSKRFDAMVAAAPEGASKPATLDEFLKKLAETFPGAGTSSASATRPIKASESQDNDDDERTAPTASNPSTTTPSAPAAGAAATPPVPVATDASSAPGAGGAVAPAPTPATAPATAPTTAPASSSSGARLVAAQFELKEVLSYSANGSTLSFSASLRSQMLFASA
jgi:hypothetical protein